ncbi:MAG: molybdopterin-guanine dinucleotide biosynthesis protein B [Chloroflexota bacterium]|nr:molybdopterin-guanine dinucleotide biosynthesis protein B [Chloroflexota bacterium]
MTIPIVCVVGKSGTGKTTFLERLIPELKRRGYRVATIKHNFDGFEVDRPGKDSWRHSQAGSDVVFIASTHKLAMIERSERDLTLDVVAARITDVDIILTEGYKHSDKPKIEIFRSEVGDELLSNPDDLVALVTDRSFDLDVPQFGLGDAAGVASLLESQFLHNST